LSDEFSDDDIAEWQNLSTSSNDLPKQRAILLIFLLHM